MYGLIGVGVAMSIWVSAMLYMERSHAKKHRDIIEAAEASSSNGTTHDVITAGDKGLDSKV